MAESIFKQMGSVISTEINNAKTSLQTDIDTSKVIVNNSLTSTSEIEALSAAQGKILDEKIENAVFSTETGKYNVFYLGSAIDTNNVGAWLSGETWDDIPSYTRTHQYTKGQFAISTNTFDDRNTMRVRMAVKPFQVNQSTGMMTWGTMGFGYQNNGGKVHSTQSFGFSGEIGMAWGHSAWGSDNTHRYGGCVWRVNSNNTVTQGGNTGNTAYTYDEQTSNGMLAVYSYGGTTYFHIPTYGSDSRARANGGSITTSNAQFQSLPSIDGGYNPSSNTSTCYIWRCIGNTVGENHAGVFNYYNGSGVPQVIALSYNGINSTNGSAINCGNVGPHGIGFEMDNGEQLYVSNAGAFIRTSLSGGLISATLTKVNNAVNTINGEGNNDYYMQQLYGIYTMNDSIWSSASYYTGGYPAKETDTFYTLNLQHMFCKIKFTKISTGVYTYEILGMIDMNEMRNNINLSSYHALVDVTGTNDDFIVTSAMYTSYAPSQTATFHNPLKDL